MNTHHTLMQMTGATLLSGGVAVAVMGLAAGTACRQAVFATPGYDQRPIAKV
jgi:hypothetical protein